MIEINLLPRELRKSQVKLPKKTIIRTAVITLVCLAVLHIILGVVARIQKNQWISLEQKWSILQPQKTQADVIVCDIQTLKNKETLIKSVKKLDVIWAKKLNLISDLIPSEIWLTKVSLEHRPRVIRPDEQRNLDSNALQELKKKSEGVLIISGVVTSSRSSEMLSPVGRFITNLKKEPLFFNDFKEVELDRAETKKIGDKEVMTFELICVLK